MLLSRLICWTETRTDIVSPARQPPFRTSMVAVIVLLSTTFCLAGDLYAELACDIAKSLLLMAVLPLRPLRPLRPLSPLISLRASMCVPGLDSVWLSRADSDAVTARSTVSGSDVISFVNVGTELLLRVLGVAVSWESIVALSSPVERLRRARFDMGSRKMVRDRGGGTWLTSMFSESKMRVSHEVVGAIAVGQIGRASCRERV